MKRDDIQFFDPKADWSVVERALPHWSQPGAITFVTWRLADSLPREVLDSLDREIAAFLRSEGVTPGKGRQPQLSKLAIEKRAEVQRRLFAIRDKYLDQGRGECQLADPECAELVLQSLRHFDEERYFLTDVVIMPNHVHFLCAFAGDAEMLRQCTDWKRYTSRQINQRLARTGEFWQVDQFDHLTRGPDDFEHYRRYIAENPGKAGLKKGEYRHYQKSLS